MASDSFSFKTRAVFASQHIVSAALFTRLCAKVEENYKERPSFEVPHEARTEQVAYVTATIFASVAFLEAAINELFADTAELEPGEIAGTLIEQLDPKVRQDMADSWNQGTPRGASVPILEKFDIALGLARQNRLKDHLYNNAGAVIVLRNALIHFEPVWTMESRPDLITYHEIYKGTKSRRINSLKKKFSNPLASRSEPFFPNKCFCRACAAWAVISCINFTKAFFESMGIDDYPSKSVMGLPLTGIQ